MSHRAYSPIFRTADWESLSPEVNEKFAGAALEEMAGFQTAPFTGSGLPFRVWYRVW